MCRFGVVFKVKDKKDKSGEVFAAKFVRCRKSEEKQKVKDEICIMNSLDHPKLLQVHSILSFVLFPLSFHLLA